jgi:hypothetical protein
VARQLIDTGLSFTRIVDKQATTINADFYIYQFFVTQVYIHMRRSFRSTFFSLLGKQQLLLLYVAGTVQIEWRALIGDVHDWFYSAGCEIRI